MQSLWRSHSPTLLQLGSALLSVGVLLLFYFLFLFWHPFLCGILGAGGAGHQGQPLWFPPGWGFLNIELETGGVESWFVKHLTLPCCVKPPLNRWPALTLGCSGIPHRTSIRLAVKEVVVSSVRPNQVNGSSLFYPHWSERSINASSWLVLAN